MPEPLISPPTPTRPQGKGALLTIFLIVFVDLLGFGIVLPNLQLYGERFGVKNAFVLTLMGATYSICQFIFAPILGKWSDRIGRRPVLLISQAGTFVGFLILFVSYFFQGPYQGLGLGLIFISRIVDGISGGNISTANAYIADVTTPENRAKGMGLLGAAFGLGFIFGPLIGGVVGGTWGVQYVAVVAAAVSLTALCMTFFMLKESLQPGAPQEAPRRFSILGFRHAMQRPVIRWLIIMFFINGFAFAGMEQTFSLLIQHRLYPIHDGDVATQTKAASRAAGNLFGCVGIILVLIQGGLIGRLTKRFGEAALVITGATSISIGLLFVGIPVHWQWAWTGFFTGCCFLAAGSALFTPSMTSLISRHAGPREQGEILGANQGIASLARALGPLLAGILFQYVWQATEWQGAAPYFASAFLTLCVALWALFNQHRLQPPK